MSYVKTKVVKRMEQFRVKNAEAGKPRTLLLPLSLGISSVSLLYILDNHLRSQLGRTGRTGFVLHVLHLALPDHDEASEAALLASIKQQFPSHVYTSTSLQGSLEARNGINGAYADEIQDHESEANSIKRTGQTYMQLLASIPTVTSRTDVLNILRTRAIVEHAKRYGCEGILWGDSTTKLAEKVLGETAKGRGFSLPWQIADGDSPWGIAFYYPMRDLLKKELAPFTGYVHPPLTSLVQQDAADNSTPAASKNGSIDLLMKQYFESVEDQYPSIVANVVRTTGKLEKKAMLNPKKCTLCMMLYSLDTEATGSQNQLPLLCYGCSSALPEASRQHLPDWRIDR